MKQLHLNEIGPANETQIIFSSIVLLIGAVLSAFIYGNIAFLMGEIGKRKQKFESLVEKRMQLCF